MQLLFFFNLCFSPKSIDPSLAAAVSPLRLLRGARCRTSTGWSGRQDMARPVSIVSTVHRSQVCAWLQNFHERLCPEKQTCKRFNSTGLLQGTWTLFITFCEVRCELGCLRALVPVSEMLPGFPELAVGSHHQAAPECGDEKRRRGALVWTWPRAMGRCYQKEWKQQKIKMQKNAKMTTEKGLLICFWHAFDAAMEWSFLDPKRLLVVHDIWTKAIAYPRH